MCQYTRQSNGRYCWGRPPLSSENEKSKTYVKVGGAFLAFLAFLAFVMAAWFMDAAERFESFPPILTLLNW